MIRERNRLSSILWSFTGFPDTHFWTGSLKFPIKPGFPGTISIDWRSSLLQFPSTKWVPSRIVQQDPEMLPQITVATFWSWELELKYLKINFLFKIWWNFIIVLYWIEIYWRVFNAMQYIFTLIAKKSLGFILSFSINVMLLCNSTFKVNWWLGLHLLCWKANPVCIGCKIHV